MKIWIVYDSKYGNNKTIAEAMKERLSQHEVTIAYAKKISPKQVITAKPDAFLFGGPRRIGNISYTLRHWVEKFAKNLQAKHIQLKKVGAWETHGVFKEADLHPESDFEKKILDKNLNLGSKWKELLDMFPVEKPSVGLLSLEVQDMKGPLESGYADKLTNFIGLFEST